MPPTDKNNQPLATSESKATLFAGSKIGKVWVMLTIFTLILLLLLIFILQNSQPVKINYFGAHGSINFGIAILLSAISGVILTLIVGSARIIQLKLSKRRNSVS